MLCVFVLVQLAAQWLVIGSGDVSLYLQREIGLSTFLAAIQTYCLKVGLHTTSHHISVPVLWAIQCHSRDALTARK